MNSDYKKINKAAWNLRTNLHIFAQYPCIHQWSVDFEDWEKVLRIESRGITAARAIELLQTISITASELE